MISMFRLWYDPAKTYRNSKTCGHPVKIVWVLPHGHHLGNDRLFGPLHAEHFCKLFQVLGSSFSDRENSIAQPSHAKIAQLLIEELDSQLTGKEGNVFDDGKTHAPLLVLCQLNNGRKEGLGEKIDAND